MKNTKLFVALWVMIVALFALCGVNGQTALTVTAIPPEDPFPAKLPMTEDSARNYVVTNGGLCGFEIMYTSLTTGQMRRITKLSQPKSFNSYSDYENYVISNLADGIKSVSTNDDVGPNTEIIVHAEITTNDINGELIWPLVINTNIGQLKNVTESSLHNLPADLEVHIPIRGLSRFEIRGPDGLQADNLPWPQGNNGSPYWYIWKDGESSSSWPRYDYPDLTTSNKIVLLKRFRCQDKLRLTVKIGSKSTTYDQNGDRSNPIIIEMLSANEIKVLTPPGGKSLVLTSTDLTNWSEIAEVSDDYADGFVSLSLNDKTKIKSLDIIPTSGIRFFKAIPQE